MLILIHYFINRNQCIVGPYLQWLDDSSYEPICSLCKQQLDSQQTVRLICFREFKTLAFCHSFVTQLFSNHLPDIYHLSCLNTFANGLPPNTAPAGYTCPTCHKPIFPATASNSPVANNLRQILAEENWARIGLGMPLIQTNDNSYSELNQSSLSTTSNDSMTHSVPQVVHHNPTISSSNVPIAVNSVSNYISSNTDSTFGVITSNSRNKSYDIKDSYKSLLDIDDDKYRRKSPMEFLSRWLRYGY